jgi:acetylornithine deacetylase
MNTLELLKRLVSYPTVSRDSNLDLIHFVANYLDDLGYQTTLVHNQDKTKANLYAVIGPTELPGIMLSGHTDVVPTDGQAWSRDPFKARVLDDRLYGRGTTDMKGYIAAVLAMLPKIASGKLNKPIHLCFSYDEEIGCVGVRSLIDRLERLEIKPELCIIGEPTSMQAAIAHKGKTAARCHCHGSAAHSALTDRGLNAIYLATDMISEIRQLQDKIISHGNHDTDYDVPYTTLHVGTINGGTVVNIVPDHCNFGFEIRNIGGDNPDAMIDELNEAAAKIVARHNAKFANAGIDIEVHNQYPALDIAADAAAVKFVKSLTNKQNHSKLAFGTEGGLFQQRLNMPTVICGPGSMNQGHKPDEYIELSELQACDTVMQKLANHLAS